MFTNPRVYLTPPGSAKTPVLAHVTVKVADAIYLSGIRVVNGKHGIFVGMPQRKTTAGEHQDVYFPANKEIRNQLEKIVLDAYHQALDANRPVPAALQ